MDLRQVRFTITIEPIVRVRTLLSSHRNKETGHLVEDVLRLFGDGQPG